MAGARFSSPASRRGTKAWKSCRSTAAPISCSCCASCTCAAFNRRGLWQKLIAFVAPLIIGGPEAPAILQGEGVSRLTEGYRFRFDRVEFVGGDLMIVAYPS